MRHCDPCDIDLSGDLDRCPLCGSVLEGEATPAAFPVSTAEAPAMAARRVLAAVTGAAAIALLIATWLVPLRPWPVALMMVALVVGYGFLRNVMAHSPDFVRIAERYFLVLLAMAVLWWLAAGSGLVASLVIPGICLGGLLTNTALVVAFREAFVRDYAKYLLYSLLLGLAPLLLLPLNAAPWPWLIYASAAASALLALTLLLLARKQLKAELRKLFSA